MQVVSLAFNLPGPAAARRLQELGARVTKVEPPTGDPMKIFSLDWYHAMTDGQEIITLNLKDPPDRAALNDYLAAADLLLTSSRLRALRGLGLGWEDLHARFPRMCHVAIVGYPDPRQDEPGHDLTYQAEIGLVQPPTMPNTLIADLHGAERAVSAALALLLAREQGEGAGYAEVALSDAAEVFAAPLRYGATREGGVLGGGMDGYRLYEAKDGWVALAALEPVFIMRVQEQLGDEPVSVATIGAFLGAMTVAEIEAWGREHDIPVCGVNEQYAGAASP
jgi:alpha-methylacyl-CoA racemase